MKKSLFFTFGEARDWREWYIAVAVAVLLFVGAFVGLKISDNSQTKKMDSLAQGILTAEREQGDVTVSVGSDETLISMKYILLQRPVNARRFEGQQRWVRVASGSENVDEDGDGTTSAGVSGSGFDDADAVATPLESEFAWLHNQVLFERESNARIAPGSMAKLMTILLSVEAQTDFEKAIYLDWEAFTLYYENNAAIAGFSPGDTVTVRDLLEGAMLTPGAECATALALETAGSREAFVQRMNDKAMQIGMSQTHFTNETGLESDGDYTTVSDLALLLDYALSNPQFYEIFTQWEYTTSPVYASAEGLKLRSTLYEKNGFSPNIFEGRILGAKTGTTDSSAQCISAVFEKGGVLFIFVSAEGQPGYSTTHTSHTDDLLTACNLITVENAKQKPTE